MITMLHIIERLSDFGGTPRKMLCLAKNCDPRRYKLVFLVYLQSNMKQEFEQYGAIVRNLNTLSPIKLAWEIASEAKRVKADVICTHFTRPLLTGYFASKLRGLPLIHNEHSSTYYRKRLGHFWAKFCLPSANAVVCNSNHTRSTIEAEYKILTKKIRVLYPPVEERVVTSGRQIIRNRLKLVDDDIVIGHIGKMIPERDQETLIKAFHLIHGKHPNTRLAMVGNGPMRSRLEALVRKLGLNDDVIFIGETDRVGDYLSAMDIYVNTCLDEGFGIAVVEAMLAKLPVVLSDRGAHPELITNGKSGLLYKGGDCCSLTETLKFLIADQEKRKKIGQEAYDHANICFAPANYAISYVSLVEEVLRSSKSVPFSSFQEVL